MNECLGYVFGRHFASKEVSGQVVFFSRSTGLCSRPDHLVGEKTTPNSVSINRVHPDLVSTIFQRILPSQRQGSSFRNTVRPKIRTGIDRLLGDIEYESATGFLPAHHSHRTLRNPLTSKKVKLETPSQELIR